MGQKKVLFLVGVLIVNARVVILGMEKGVLFREVSSVQCPCTLKFHVSIPVPAGPGSRCKGAVSIP